MRTVEFRIWCNESEKFWDGPFNDRLNDIFNKKRFTFQQFTGLKDKDGKKIFEGDIVKTIYGGMNEVGSVIFDENTCAFRIKTKTMQLLPIVTIRFSSTPTLINVADLVVGNIFENKELLK